jgi:tetratricopeptide (TPR) repeat protein
VNRKERRAARKQGKAGAVLPRGEGLAPGTLSRNLFADAVHSYRAGKLDDAERLCREALTFDRNHFAALHLLGMLAAHAGNFEGAAEILGRSLAIHDSNAECHFHRGDILRTLEQYYEAVEHLARAIALKPDLVEAHVALGDTFTVNVDLEQARACYQRALALDPERIDAHYGLANAALLQGRPDDAADLYRRVIAKNPFAEAYCKLGIALASQEKWQEAMEQYRQALALKPDFRDAYRFLGYALLMLGDAIEAMAAVRQALAIGETMEARALFVQCAIALPAIPPGDGDLRTLAARAVSERWSGDENLSALAARIQ